jgi:hypothetical protein
MQCAVFLSNIVSPVPSENIAHQHLQIQKMMNFVLMIMSLILQQEIQVQLISQ